MTASAASATKAASWSSYPYCFDAIAGLRAVDREDWVKGVGSDVVVSSGELGGRVNMRWDRK